MKVPRFTNRSDFWRGLVITVLAFVVMWLYLQNRGLLHEARVESCRADQELTRKIYVTLADFGTPVHTRQKFLPSQDCESLP